MNKFTERQVSGLKSDKLKRMKRIKLARVSSLAK